MKVTFKTGSEANYGSTNGELFFASNTKQIMLNGIKYIPKKLSELTNDSGFLTSITKSMVENVLTGNITTHTHSYLPLSGGTLTGNLTCNGSYITMSGGAGAKGYSGYFNNPKRSDRASYSHILGDGYAYGTNAISIGTAAYAGIRNTDSDSGTYPYLHWQWMDCLQVQETTSGTAVNCYGAILTNAGGNKDTATFSLCIDDMCVAYGMAGNSEELNNFLSFTNTNASYGRVVVYIADNKSGDSNERIFAGTTSHPRSQSNVKIGNVPLGQGCKITDVASMSVNGVTVYRVAFYFWNKTLSASYDITQKTTAIVCTKVNNTNYSGASSYASGSYSVASGSSSVASGYSSVASGYSSVASGYYSVASGYSSVASGSYSVASGFYSVASGSYSVAKHEGSKVYALRGVSGLTYQTVLGRDNVETSAASVVVGWGSSDTARKNIFVLDTNGNATFGSGGAGTVTAATFKGALSGNATTASKIATARTITVGSTSKSFDGSSDIKFTLDSIITQNDTINVGTLNVAEQLTTKNITIGNNLTISSGVDVSGLTPSMIGAAAASHTHTFGDLNGVAAEVHTHNYIVTEGDKRSEGTAPNKYPNKFIFSGLKYNSVIGNPSSDTYSYILGLRGWSDSSGGNSHELAFNNSGIFRRSGATTEWGNWYKLLDSGNYTNYAATKDHTHLYAGSASAGGAATSAVKLNTARKLWGQSFDGSADVYGNIYLYPSNMEVATTRGIREFSLSGFIGFVNPSVGDTDNFSGICLGWASNPTTAAASLRINASTFAYKGNTVWHGGNLKLGYTSSGLSRAVQKDTNGNLYIVAPSLFEQGISNNYPKNLRWITTDEGQLAYDTEETAGVPSTVQVSIPVANGTSKGFMKSISTVTDVTGYTPCPVKSGTPYYKLDAIELDYTDFLEIGSGDIESHLPITVKVQEGGSLEYLFDYTVDNIPRLITISAGNFCKYFFWLQQTDDDTPIVAYYHCQFNDLWLVIDSPNREIRISQGGF